MKNLTLFQAIKDAEVDHCAPRVKNSSELEYYYESARFDALSGVESMIQLILVNPNPANELFLVDVSEVLTKLNNIAIQLRKL